MNVFHLELPPLCNQECVFCIISAKRQRSSLNLDVPHFLKLAISQTEEGDAVYVAGGEPTYWNNIETLFRAILKMRRRAYVVTNGSNPERLSELIDAGMEQAVFSFFAFDPAIHAKITGAGFYPRLIESLELFRRRKKEIHINYVVNFENQDRISKDVAALVSEYPVSAITFQLLIPMGKWAEVPLPRLKTASNEVNRAIKSLVGSGMFLRTSFFPHCLMEHPEYAEKYERSKTAQRKEFALRFVHSGAPAPCLNCRKFEACGGVPSGYPETDVVPFA